MSQLIPVDLIVDNLDDVVTEVQTKLEEFIEREDWQKQLAIAFGNNFSFKEAKDIITGLTNDQSNIDIQLLPSKQLKGRGGFDGEKIYLAEELFFQKDLSQAIEVLIEETGHLLEQKLKLEDRPGDEGAVFEAIINQKPLTEVELEALKQEGDRTIIEINGKRIVIEQASLELNNDLGEVFSINRDTPEEMSLLFQWTQREARYNNELGVVVFDNPEGKVNGVAPGKKVIGKTCLILPAEKLSLLAVMGQEIGNS